MTSHIGSLVLLTRSAIPRLIVGLGIGLYAIRQAIEIMHETGSAEAIKP